MCGTIAQVLMPWMSYSPTLCTTLSPLTRFNHMLDSIYKVEGKYPDPNQIENELNFLRSDPSRKREYSESLSEIRSSGLSSHPLLSRFFVEV